jgi:hypothetical protein
MRKNGSLVEIIFKFSDDQYGGTHPYRSHVPLRRQNYNFFGIHPVRIATARTGRYDRTARPYRVHRLNPEAATPNTGKESLTLYKSIMLGNYGQRKYIMIFWASSCHFVRNYFYLLESLL